MGFVELLLLAVGLSMDACAVSICKGLCMRKATLKAQAICGVWFGGFQALMPLIGFFLGTLFADAIEAVDHWVAFVLLALIGANMLKEAFERRPIPAMPTRQTSLRKPCWSWQLPPALMPWQPGFPSPVPVSLGTGSGSVSAASV
jgi:putative Mn2+ efflux pump MntP